jgi:hypothetical protein
LSRRDFVKLPRFALIFQFQVLIQGVSEDGLIIGRKWNIKSSLYRPVTEIPVKQFLPRPVSEKGQPLAEAVPLDGRNALDSERVQHATGRQNNPAARV